MSTARRHADDQACADDAAHAQAHAHAHATATAHAFAVAHAVHERERGDALAGWLATRDAIIAPELVARAARLGPVVGRRDGHRHFIDSVDAARDPARAARLHAALDAARALAKNGAPFALSLVCGLQACVAGGAAVERSSPAFAKSGGEVYSYDARTRERLMRACGDARDLRVPALLRAARAYLDICFFHPFEDGNARAARLALDFVLAAHGTILDEVGPLFVVRRPAGDPAAHQSFGRLICVLAEATARRATSTPLHTDSDSETA